MSAPRVGPWVDDAERQAEHARQLTDFVRALAPEAAPEFEVQAWQIPRHAAAALGIAPVSPPPIEPDPLRDPVEQFGGWSGPLLILDQVEQWIAGAEPVAYRREATTDATTVLPIVRPAPRGEHDQLSDGVDHLCGVAPARPADPLRQGPEGQTGPRAMRRGHPAVVERRQGLVGHEGLDPDAGTLPARG